MEGVETSSQDVVKTNVIIEVQDSASETGVRQKPRNNPFDDGNPDPTRNQARPRFPTMPRTMPHLPAPPPRPPAKPIWTMDSCGRLASVCFKMVVILLLGLVCFLLTQKEDRVSVLQSASPSPPTPPTTSPTPPTTASPSTTYEYKVVGWKSDYYEGCTSVVSGLYCFCGSPPSPCSDSSQGCNNCGGQVTQNGASSTYSNQKLVLKANPLSKSSAVDVLKKEGITDNEIFTGCSFPTSSSTYSYGDWSTYSFSTTFGVITEVSKSFGSPWSGADETVRTCLTDKLKTKLLDSGSWVHYSTSDVGDDYTLHFRKVVAS